MSRDYDPALEPAVEFYRVADEDLTGEPGNLIRSEQLAQEWCGMSWGWRRRS